MPLMRPARIAKGAAHDPQRSQLLAGAGQCDG